MTTPVLQHIADAPRVEGMGGAISVRLRSEETGDRLALIESADPAWNRGLPQLAREVVQFLDSP